MKVFAVRYAYPENAGFTINRPKGHEHYTFLHFYNPMTVKINGKTVVTEPHACIVYQPSFPQFFCSDMPIQHDWIHFYDIDKNFFDEIGIPLNRIFYPKRHEFITHITREVENEFNSNYKNKPKLLNLKLEELFIKLKRYTDEPSPEKLSTSLVSSLRWLRENTFLSLDKKHTVSSLANKVGLSESRFFSVYKSLFGISPMEDIINAKIDLAKNLLLSSEQKISLIAKSLGYSDVTHFIRQFKAKTGVSPSIFRKS